MRNKKVAAFFKQKSYVIAAVIMLVAAFGMTGIYYSQQNKKQEQKLAQEQQEQIQQAKAEDQQKAEAAKKAAQAKADAARKEAQKIETEAVSGIIPPESSDNFMDSPEVVSKAESPVEPSPHFDAEADMQWPIQGNVIMNFSMDQTVYFATLDQYKYNPALIIQAEVNSQIAAVAEGKITAIETNEETGATMTVDMGDGYSAVYGQLKEIPQEVGDHLEAGEAIGYISEPTKYFSVEGSNLYFQLLKDGVPINPMEFLQ